MRLSHGSPHPRRESAAVGSDVGERLRERRPQVGFGVAEGDLKPLALLLHEQIEQRFLGGGPARFPEIEDREPVHLVAEGTHERPLPSRARRLGFAQLDEEPLALGRVGDPLEHPPDAPFLGPIGAAAKRR